ncbi:restriction endonuclease [Acidithiobacillus ferrooxidans]|uniref:restriction endonuclease n=1 Tax=Acidithiobacillus ferrooxidans TaxID=920 RepID=UPI0013D5B532|nr:restriction endonuclease [Acidithiobacillus ferrooxidans]MCR2830445.1 restriction endonuclease [Acidithiobacillus ferrooxidans]
MTRNFNSGIKSLMREIERSSRAKDRANLAQQREDKKQQRTESMRIKKEQKSIYIETQLNKAENENSRTTQYINSLNKILVVSLDKKPEIDFSKLYKTPSFDSLDLKDIDQATKEPTWSDYKPDKPFFVNFFPWLKDSYNIKLINAKNLFDDAMTAFHEKEKNRLSEIIRRRESHRCAVENAEHLANSHNRTVDYLREFFSHGVPDAITAYFEIVLLNSSYPSGFQKKSHIEYQKESKQLIVAYDLPFYEDIIPTVKSKKYVKSTDSFSEIYFSENQRKSIYTNVISQIALRSIHEIFTSDTYGFVDTIVFNGHVFAINKGTGKHIHPCILTVRITKDRFNDFDLSQVDPTACMKTMSASVSKSPAELVPVRPVVELNMSDPRFVEDENILSALDQRPNLMDLTPNEFESLITNLFQSMGLETRLTQASRDGGVDCVAFDSRPIFGGKVVIQAKRYKNTVGVSAVRDLFGTMQNEGASKGILVTTSGYGKASFEFADGKPIELLSGSNLLYLLNEYADIDAKIVMPEDWKDYSYD